MSFLTFSPTRVSLLQVVMRCRRAAGGRRFLSDFGWGRALCLGVFSWGMLCGAGPIQAQNALDVQVLLEDDGEFSPGWIIAAPRFSSNLTYPIVVSAEGEVVFNELRPLTGFNFDQNPNGQLSWFSTLDGNWQILDSALMAAGVVEFLGADEDYHDLELREDGTRLLMGKETFFMTLEDSIPAGDDPERAVIDCLLQEQDAQGNILWSWRATDHIPPTWCSHCNWNAGLIDAYHHNSFETQPDGNILLCLRNMDLVVLIDRQSGELLWKLGGPESDFDFVDEAGPFAQQHDAQLLTPNRILLYDNATGSSPLVSRGVEYLLDQGAATATVVQTWPHPDGSFASSQGSIQRLEDGGTLVGWGNALTDAWSGGSVSEFGPDGALRGTVYFPSSHISYRARKVAAGQLPLSIGCMDPEACNFDESAIVDSGCLYIGSPCDDGNGCTVGDVVQEGCQCLGFFPPTGPVDQCLDPLALNFNPCSALPFDDGSCQYAVTFRVDPTASGTSPQSMAIQFPGTVPLPMEPAGFGTWRAEVILGSGVWQHEVFADGAGDGISRSLDLSFPADWDGGEVRACLGIAAEACPGCSDPDAPDYSPFATGSGGCGQGALGCTVFEAVNFDPQAAFDDGSCVFGTSSDCAMDLTGDGIIGIADVLFLLSYFGLACD